MSILVKKKDIGTIGLIDDDDNVRRGYRYSTDDLAVSAEEVTGPIRDVDALLAHSANSFDAVICDYNLKTKNYSSVNGDELCVRFYKASLPAVLCTRFDGNLPLPIRKNRRFIPVVIAPADLDPDVLVDSLAICIDEMSGIFTKGRKPYRALLRIEGGEVNQSTDAVLLNLVVPSWNSGHMFTMEIDSAAGEAYTFALQAVEKGVVERLFADVNLDAELADDLFISDWRLR